MCCDFMKESAKEFLYLLKCAINEEKVPSDYTFNTKEVFAMAQLHNVLPLIYNAAVGSSVDLTPFKKVNIISVAEQIRKNILFKELYEELCSMFGFVVIVKGPVCAKLYPEPDLRISSDFDIIMIEDKLSAAADYLVGQGFDKKNEAFHNKNNGLYIELSSQLAEGGGRLKKLALEITEGMLDRCREDEYLTLEPTDNMIYLIYHAFKHFISCGFGIRQVIDIMLYAEHYKNEIDFEKVFNKLSIINGHIFAYNIFAAAEKIFERDFSFILRDVDKSLIKYDVFIEDLLEAGVFGKSSEDRIHSATMVISAVNNNGRRNIFKTLLPGFSVMKGRYTILKYVPILLPLFWVIRCFDYLFKSIGSKKSVSPIRSIEIANERVSLMRELKIIDR